MKRFLFLILAFSILPLSVFAASMEVAVSSEMYSPPVKISAPYMATDYEKSYVVFETEVAASGDYQLLFRIMPACLGNGFFTKYDVSVDMNQVGSITPHSDTWQNLAMDKHEKINLSKGKHNIILSAPYGTPMLVEEMYVLENNNGEIPSTQAYDSFMESCRAGEVSFMSEMKAEREVLLGSSNAIMSGQLLYTFHIFLDLKGGDELLVQTASRMGHCIDLVYWGQSKGFMPSLLSQDEISELADTFQPPKDPIDGPGFVKATPKEKAGFTFTGISEINNTDKVNIYGRHEITKTIRIPKEGRYYFRVRSIASEARSTAMVSLTSKSINGYWAQAPVTDSYYFAYVPAGGEYTTYTRCEDPSNAHPIMFMQLYLGSQIQNYSNQFTLGDPSDFNCKNTDVSCQGKPSFPLGIVSVNALASSAPASSYQIIYNLGGTDNAIMKLMNEMSSSPDISGILKDDLSIFVERNEIVITNAKDFSILDVYDINGKQLTHTKLQSEEGVDRLWLTDIGINSTGIYIVRVEGDGGSKVIKVKF